jgi:hypothetical protein
MVKGPFCEFKASQQEKRGREQGARAGKLIFYRPPTHLAEGLLLSKTSSAMKSSARRPVDVPANPGSGFSSRGRVDLESQGGAFPQR